VAERSTTDGACIVRVWVEPGDRTLRGRVESVPGGPPVAAYGVTDLLAAVRVQLEQLQQVLTGSR